MKAIRIIIILNIFASIITNVNAQQSDLDKNKLGLLKPGILMIGMEIGYPPMEYFADDGKTPIGFSIDMSKAIADKLGLKVEFVDTAWDGIFVGVDRGRYDAIISSVTITEARMRAYNFSKPYFADTLAMVLLKNSTITARTPEECAGLTVAFQADTTADFYMQDLEDYMGLKFFLRGYEKAINCFDELRLGRVDVVITEMSVAMEYAAAGNSLFSIVWEDPEPGLFGICMKNGNAALTNAINNVLDELFKDGTMSRISKKHSLGDYPVIKARQLW